MASYGYPCCSDLYNIRMYDNAGAIVWSRSLANGATITHLAMHGDDYLYFSCMTGGSSTTAKKFLFKYDITGASPSLVWEVSGTSAVLGSNSNGLSGLAVNQSSGDVYCVTQNNYTPLAPQLPPAHFDPYATDEDATGYYILRYSSAGVYLGRRKIQFIDNLAAHTAYRDGAYMNARGGPICVDSSGYVYVGLQATYTTEGADGIAHYPALAGSRIINVAKYNADLSTVDAFSTYDYTDIESIYTGSGFSWTVRDLIVDGTNLYWCVSGYRYPSGIRVVSGMNKSTGASAWPAGADNSSKNYGYGKIRSLATGIFIFAGRTQEAPSGYTNGSLRAWAPDGTYQHSISGVAMTNAIDITPDAMLVATRIVNVDQYAASDPSPEVREMLSGTLVHELDYANNGSARRPLAAKALSDSHPLNPTGFILAGYLIP